MTSARYTSPLWGEVGPEVRVRGMKRFIARAKALRGKETSAEARLWCALRNRQLSNSKFRRQWPVDRYIVDFVCLDAKLIIEVDGATHSTQDELRRDQQRSAVLESCGFRILHVPNAEVYENLTGVIETILAELEHRVTL